VTTRRISLGDIDWFAAGFSITAIALHDAAHVEADNWFHGFWVCNAAALVVGPALFARSGLWAQVALTWLLPGTAVWLVDALLTGQSIMPTSYNVHIGGLLSAAWGVARFGPARRGWLAALALLAFVLALSRIALPAAPNVNAVHAVPLGWSFLGSTQSAFLTSAALIIVLVCGLGEVISRALGGRLRND
jgi:hypothetical protein